MDQSHHFGYKSNMSGIENYNLFGEQGDMPDVVHCETIETRSLIHDWHLAPHRHARLHQFLLLEDGRGEVQIESRAGIDALDDILAVDGIDGVFIGPADLSTDMGFKGNAAHPEARAAILDALRRIAASDKAAGCLALDDDTADLYLEQGTRFLAVGIDVHLMIKAARAKAAQYAGRKAGEG